VALHGWLASITGTHGGRSREAAAYETPAPAARITLRIDQASSPAPPAVVWPARIDSTAVARETRSPPPSLLPGPSHPVSPALEADPGLPRAHDNTYYLMQQVDVFPAPVSPLAMAAIGDGAAAGRVLMLVSIDEAGVVSDAVLIEGGSASIEAALRAVLLPARFTPALKNGRAVKSRVVLSVE
jgi:protein TonB